MCAWCDAHSSWMQEDEKVEEINSQASCDVVASHQLFAELFKEIGAKYLELAALVPEFSKVTKAVVAAPKVTASPAEKREESLQALREATIRSSAAEKTMRKYNKKLEAAKKSLEDLQAKTADLEEKRKEAYVELVRAQEGVAAARMAAPCGNGMDVDDGFEQQKWNWPEQKRSQLQKEGNKCQRVRRIGHSASGVGEGLCRC